MNLKAPMAVAALVIGALAAGDLADARACNCKPVRHRTSAQQAGLPEVVNLYSRRTAPSDAAPGSASGRDRGFYPTPEAEYYAPHAYGYGYGYDYLPSDGASVVFWGSPYDYSGYRGYGPRAVPGYGHYPAYRSFYAPGYMGGWRR